MPSFTAKNTIIRKAPGKTLLETIRPGQAFVSEDEVEYGPLVAAGHAVPEKSSFDGTDKPASQTDKPAAPAKRVKPAKPAAPEEPVKDDEAAAE